MGTNSKNGSFAKVKISKTFLFPKKGVWGRCAHYIINEAASDGHRVISSHNKTNVPVATICLSASVNINSQNDSSVKASTSLLFSVWQCI